jgi:hypothetical protein
MPPFMESAEGELFANFEGCMNFLKMWAQPKRLGKDKDKRGVSF